MKKTLFKTCFSLLITSILSTSSLVAQNFYIDGHLGFSSPINGSTRFGANETTNYGLNGQYNYEGETVKLSLGQGLNFGINVGYFFNDHIGLDLGLNYQIGSTTQIENTRVYNRQDQFQEVYQTTYFNKNIYSSNMLHITPSLVLKTEYKKFSPYAKIGFVMGIGKVFRESNFNQTYSDPQQGSSSTNYSEFEYSGGLGLGLTGAIGTTYNLNEKLNLFTEVYFRSMSYAPKNGFITKSIEDGIDNTDQLLESEKTIIFSKEITYSSENDPNSPQEAEFTRIPFNSIGLKLGVRFNL